MKIEYIRLRNFRVFKDVVVKNIGNMSVIVGANGGGKSTLFDVFSFLKDAFSENVQKAIDKRGGFREVVSRGSKGSIEIEILFKPYQDGKEAGYFLSIKNDGDRVYVKNEKLEYTDKDNSKKSLLIDFQKGAGIATTVYENNQEKQKLISDNVLAIKGFSQFEKFEVAGILGRDIENWYLSDININKIQNTYSEGYATRLSENGSNIAVVAKYLSINHPDIFKKILVKLSERIPGISTVETKTTEDGRVLLKFKDGSFQDPFSSRYVSDGTIKMFAYLIILYHPEVHPLLCVEEPENRLYPSILHELAEEFRLYSNRGCQVFISTHSPDLLNAMKVNEVYFIKKNEGLSVIENASDNKECVDAVEGGDIMGYLWKEGFFEGVDPN